jgi:hypothetical protein
MERSTDNIIRIIKALNEHSNLIIDGKNKSTDNLIRISKECSKRNIELTVRLDDTKLTDNIIRLIKVSGGKISIELI